MEATPSLAKTAQREHKTTLSPEQIAHRFFQSEKLRQTKQLQNQLSASKDSRSSDEENWNLEGRIVTPNTPGVVQIAFSHKHRQYSYLFAFLNIEQLQVNASAELLVRWQGLINEGKVVGKKGQQGIRILNASERAKIAKYLSQEGYVAKLKLVGLFGEVRAYAKMISGEIDARQKMLCFDIAVYKSHSI